MQQRNRPGQQCSPTRHEEVDDMAASLVIEEESGTSVGWIHPHNGYYAGDLSRSRDDSATTDRYDGHGFDAMSAVVLTEVPRAHFW